jgi:hypothetical protein
MEAILVEPLGTMAAVSEEARLGPAYRAVEQASPLVEASRTKAMKLTLRSVLPQKIFERV